MRIVKKCRAIYLVEVTERLYSASRKYHVTSTHDFHVVLHPHSLVVFGLKGVGRRGDCFKPESRRHVT